MKHLVERYAEARVLIVGDLMLDEFIFGTVARISPEAPVPVVAVARRTYVPGGAANTAANAAALGATTFLVGLTGDDDAGKRMKELLEGRRVSTTGLVVDGSRATTTKTRIVAQTQQVVRIDQETLAPPSASMEFEMLRRIESSLSTVKACVLSDYGKGVVTPSFAQALIRACREAHVPVIVDPKGTEYAKYRGATLVKPNLLEAGQVLNRELPTTDDVNRAGRDLQLLLGPDSGVLITRGAQGMTLFEADGTRTHVPAAAREVYDVTGAGDTVAATMALTLAVGGTSGDACRLASLAAAVVVGKVGTATCTPDELLAAVAMG